MRYLFLDLASHSGLLACVEDQTIKASEPVDHRIGDHELIPLFEKTLDAAGWKAADLTHIACVIGPGGFMSLRVAVAFANTLIHQLKIPGAGIHLSDLCAARSFSSSGSDEQTSIPQPLPPQEEGGCGRGWQKSSTPADLLLYAREMRKKPTEAEEKLWEELRHDVLGVRFRRQYVLEGAIFDFYCPELKFVIEVDGEIHDNPECLRADQERDERFAEGYHIKTIRFTNDEVLHDVEGVLGSIKKHIQKHSPSLVERGEGGEVKTKRIGKGFLWLHSTKKNELFVRGFGFYASLWPEATHVTVEDFLLHAAEIRESQLRWCGELIPEHEALFKEKKLQPVALCPLAEVLPAFLQKQTFTGKLLEPWYGRSW